MGLNISGIVIDKDYSENISELEAIIGEKLLFEKEVMFVDSCESFKEDGHCDIFYSEKGTFILLTMEKGGLEFYVKNQNIFSFVLSEMTMTFCINYVKNGKNIRTIIEAEDKIMENEGTPFDFEKNEDDKPELIYHLIEKTLGESFHEIALDAKCLRYTFKQEEFNAKTIKKAVENNKPWWKIW
ncbi:hypothetical protein [Mariniflexile sp. AS56]|uniref:hypothetical protein n=1 Tax=Mariniflexile sp. AS56 TaxID=3063957 RepID=UPI0026EE43D1|nr:hypothetical protein [Mariniflexile sp. AS56]MDO7171477.1 hypothetical protein [Mariniflexile sp. AS56]